MKAEISFSQLWANPSVRKFFFRTQSEDTLQELADRSADWEDAIERIDGSIYEDLDEVEELFYEESVEWLADEFGIELVDADDEDEE